MKNKQNLVFRLEKQQLPDYNECNNFLGFEEYEIIEFNFDGKGTALILEDGRLTTYYSADIDFILSGGWYSLVKD